MWRSLRLIKTPMVEPQNKFSVARETTVPDNSALQVPLMHDLSEIFDRDTFNGKTVGKV